MHVGTGNNNIMAMESLGSGTPLSGWIGPSGSFWCFMEGSNSMVVAAAWLCYNLHLHFPIDDGCHPPVAPLSSFLSGDKEQEQHKVKGPLAAGEVVTGLHVASPVPDVFAVVPPKLADKILMLEFLHMSDLLLEQWRINESQEGHVAVSAELIRSCSPDILVWLDCFSTMVAVLSAKFSNKTPHCMVYQQLSSMLVQTLLGPHYDICFRQKTANRCSLN